MNSIEKETVFDVPSDLLAQWQEMVAYALDSWISREEGNGTQVTLYDGLSIDHPCIISKKFKKALCGLFKQEVTF